MIARKLCDWLGAWANRCLSPAVSTELYFEKIAADFTSRGCRADRALSGDTRADRWMLGRIVIYLQGQKALFNDNHDISFSINHPPITLLYIVNASDKSCVCSLLK